MIRMRDGIIEMHTQNSSYVLSTERGLVECLYYGGRIQLKDAAPLQTKAAAGYGSDVLRQAGQPALSSLCLELSATNRGDYRRGALLAEGANGTTRDFCFAAASMAKGGVAPAGGMPMAHGGSDTLILSLFDKSGLNVQLYYTVFYDADVITKKMRVTNNTPDTITLRRALSHQLDLPRCDFDLYTLTGAWARELQLTKQDLAPGIRMFGSGTGASGNRCNPFFYLAQTGAGENSGDVYGFNLVYSGSHEAAVEVDTHGRIRVSQGIYSDGFAWPLQPGESFITPEAVLTYSAQGKTGMSHNMHKFVQNHIVPPRWARVPRPVLVNNWEGTYFNFSQAKLLAMARVARKLGVELFVLDDGWFGARNNDKAGLGDYAVNKDKLPGGLSGLAREINALGMDFGLWMEPEMVNADSDLYRAHPDWAVKAPEYTPTTGRNQYVLDLCRDDVREYIVRSVQAVLNSAEISYVKWDMNRHLADNYSPVLANQGAFMHSYILGLYQILTALQASHPHVLFEGCASGGNRFDLGMLRYMPQIWLSDDTDAHERQKIQTGASYGYPPCVMGCHVAAVPNHQTLRKTPLDTRFNTAAFGLLGYELDMRHLTARQKSDIVQQIAFYKKHRATLQFGRFYRLKSPFEEDACRWMVVSADGQEAVVGDFLNLLKPNSARPPLRMAGLQDDALYEVRVRGQGLKIKDFGGLVNYILPVHLNPEGPLVKTADKLYRLPPEKESYIAYGSLLRNAGVHFYQGFTGTGYEKEMRLDTDFGSRLIVLTRLK